MKRKGVILIFSFWLFLLLTLFCLGMGFRTFIKVKKTRLFIDRARGQALASSGIALARAVLESDDWRLDHYGERWPRPIELSLDYRRPKRQAVLYMRISDESARVNLNSLSREEMRRLLEGGADGLADYILDYCDSDRQERAFESERNVKNGPLAVAEELFLIKGFSPDDYARIKAMVTTFGDGKVNVNTADKALLEVLVEDPAAKSKIFAARFDSAGESPGYFDAARWEDFLESLPSNVRRSFDERFKINSDVFRIDSRVEAGDSLKKITCVYNRASGKILYWHEE